MDEDGFFMGELDGIRGLVPSNFLTDADQHSQGGPSAASVAQRSLNNRGRGIGPGARGPPPPPRDNMGMNQRKGTQFLFYITFVLNLKKKPANQTGILASYSNLRSQNNPKISIIISNP